MFSYLEGMITGVFIFANPTLFYNNGVPNRLNLIIAVTIVLARSLFKLVAILEESDDAHYFKPSEGMQLFSAMCSIAIATMMAASIVFALTT